MELIQFRGDGSYLNWQWGSFRFLPTGLEVVGEPTYDEWQDCFTRLRSVEKALNFIIGDMLNYGETRWGEKFSQVLDEYDAQTLANIKWVSRAIPPEKRNPALSFGHHAEVAALMSKSPEKAEELLERAVSEKLSIRATRTEVRETKQAIIKEEYSRQGYPTTTYQYNIIVADPPWTPDYSEFESTRTVDKRLGMAVDELSSIKVDGNHIHEIIAQDAYLFLVVPNTNLLEGMQVLQNWGFTYKSNIAELHQVPFDPEGYFMTRMHNLILVGKRGSLHAPDLEYRVESQLQGGSHRERISELQLWLDHMYPDLPKVELFTGTRHPGWSTWDTNLPLIRPIVPLSPHKNGQNSLLTTT